MVNRQIVLDTETTGLEPKDGHRIIEIGCVEVVNRQLTGKRYHQYIHPERNIDEGAFAVHGISSEFLQDKPRFREIYPAFLEFVQGAELIIHNAPFDVGFLNHEFALLATNAAKTAAGIDVVCSITDSLQLARSLHPGQKNSLDALCKRYEVDNTHRDLHGALLDAEILAEVYLKMTGGQMSLSLEGQRGNLEQSQQAAAVRRLFTERPPLKIIIANSAEQEAHRLRLQAIQKSSGLSLNWPE